MEWHKIGGWAQDHPYATGGIVLGVGLLLLWYLGYFSASAKSSDGGGQSSLAGAYYAAEAQQAVVGGQIQQATIAEAGATSRAGIAAQGAGAIAATYAQRDVMLGQQHVGVSQIEATRDVALGDQGLLIARNNNDATNFQTVANNDYLLQSQRLTNDAASAYEIYHTIIPQEMAATGGGPISFFGAGQQVFAAPAWSPGTPISLAGQGYTTPQIEKILNL